MNILIIGSGGREHAIAWKVAQSPKAEKVYALPGNPGIGQVAENVGGILVDDHEAVIRFCKEKQIDLVIVGPEAPLADGIADALSDAEIRCFGPRKAAAQIEASKVFSKHFMARHGIPTARYATFSKLEEAIKHLDSVDYPVVIKASGLAAGKGVILPDTKAETESVLREIMESRIFGDAGSEVVIEERMSGPEVSLMAFTDGKTVVPMISAQDHKRLLDGDHGPNTGGMGAYAPAPIFTAALLEEALEDVLKPAVSGLRVEGTPFVGVLYAGLMLTPDGIRVLEFNCRFGDPETQVVLPLLETDLVDIAGACADGHLADVDIRWKDGAAVCVVLASKGYPEKADTGLPIRFTSLPENTACFHAGTKVDDEGQVVTAGGRVLGLTAWSQSLAVAVENVYGLIGQIQFQGMQCRSDIAHRVLSSTDARADRETEKRMDNRIAEGQADYKVSKLVALSTDALTYKVNGLAFQVHNEIGPGHAEKFYQRRLAELCRDAGLAVEMEKRVEVWIAGKLVGYLKLDLWVEESLVVECKSMMRPVGNDEIGQVLTYLAATGARVGMLYNFGGMRLQTKRILAPRDVEEWRKHLYRFIIKSPGMSLPPLGGKSEVPPVRFNVIDTESKHFVVPSPSGAAIRLSASKSAPESAYASSGVDIDAGNRAVELMKGAVKATYTPAVLAGIGSFGGLFDAENLKRMDNPVLVASTDGVGTKVKLAAAVGRYRGIGHDIVNHCINDILVQGARPLFFMDYFATSKLNPEQTAEVVTGIAEACREAGMALLGGETAEMPGVYQPGEFDVAGTIVGVLERERILPRTAELKAGDVLIGLCSSGPHTNGFSLIRKVFVDTPLDAVFSELGGSLADALLAPHRSYFNVLYPHLNYVKALAHLTGGGFVENIPRVLPNHLDAVIQPGAWDVPPLWDLIQKKGNIATEEMFRVFNMGIGMVAVVDKADVAALQKSVAEPVFVIGELAAGERKVRLK